MSKPINRVDVFKLEALHVWNKFTLQNHFNEKAAKLEFNKILTSLTSSNIALDIGANVGEFTIPLAKSGAQVFAIEPDPHAFSILQKTTAPFSNVTLINAAASDKDGETMLYRSSAFDKSPDRLTKSSSLFADKKNVSAATGFKVQTIDFCAFLKKLGSPVKLMKVDIEGAEVPLFENIFEQNLETRFEHAFVETHERDIPEIAVRTRQLKQHTKDLENPSINWNWH